jgi:phosphate:Na+ symporter
LALGTLPLLLALVSRFREAFGLGAEPAAVVAGFHTLFNLLGVALMLPLTDRLVALLERRFRTPEEEEGRPRYLDRSVLSAPILATRALGLELARIGAIARTLARASLRRTLPPDRIGRHREALGQLVTAAGEYVIELQRMRLPSELGHAPPVSLRVARHYAEAAELAQEIAASERTLEPLPPELARAVGDFEGEVLALLERTAVDVEGTSPETAAEALAALERSYHALKDRLLEAGSQGRMPVGSLVAHLDRLSNVRRLAQQMERGARHLWSLGALASLDSDEAPPQLPEAHAA